MSDKQMRPMTYTQPSRAGKRVAHFLRQIRAFCVRVWLRLFAPRWTVGSLIVLKDEERRVCLLKHRGRVKPWGLPGGLVEWPESPREGVFRELREELAWLDCDSVAESTSSTARTVCISENFPLLEFVYELHSPVPCEVSQKWQLQKSEITEIKWFSRSDIENLDGILERHRRLLLDVLHSR